MFVGLLLVIFARVSHQTESGGSPKLKSLSAKPTAMKPHTGRKVPKTGEDGYAPARKKGKLVRPRRDEVDDDDDDDDDESRSTRLKKLASYEKAQKKENSKNRKLASSKSKPKNASASTSKRESKENDPPGAIRIGSREKQREEASKKEFLNSSLSMSREPQVHPRKPSKGIDYTNCYNNTTPWEIALSRRTYKISLVPPPKRFEPPSPESIRIRCGVLKSILITDPSKRRKLRVRYFVRFYEDKNQSGSDSEPEPDF